MRALWMFGWVTACGGGMNAYEVDPVEGPWSYTEVAITGGDCTFDPADVELPAAPAEIELHNLVQGFAFAWDETDPAACSLDFDTFDCLPLATWVPMQEEVTVSFAMVTEGTFVTPDHIVGDFLYEYRCNGASCPEFLWSQDLGSMPCQVTGTFEATSQF